MQITRVAAKTISDAWFQLLRAVLDDGATYLQPIQRGSYAKKGTDDPGQYRRQFFGAEVAISYPDRDIVPLMPPGVPIPPPTSMEYIGSYFVEYLMRATLQPLEQYTYGERIAYSLEEVIRMLRETPFTNQANLQVGQPSDIFLDDPPCLRIIDLKVIPAQPMNVLTMTVYFRSWDLWSGFPANLGGFELLKQYIADAAGLENGPMFAYSAGLHLYQMYEEVARIRTALDEQCRTETRMTKRKLITLLEQSTMPDDAIMRVGDPGSLTAHVYFVDGTSKSQDFLSWGDNPDD